MHARIIFFFSSFFKHHLEPVEMRYISKWLITGRARGKLNHAGRKAVLCPATRTWGSQCALQSCSATSGSSSGSLNPLCCFETKETVPGETAQKSPALPFSQDFGCPGPCGRGDASGGVEQMLSPSTGAKNAPVTL